MGIVNFYILSITLCLNVLWQWPASTEMKESMSEVKDPSWIILLVKSMKISPIKK